MPPRLQCLNAARLIKQQNVYSRATFSTTARALIDEPSASSSAMDLLNALTNDTSIPPTPSPSAQFRTRRPSSTNPNGPPGPTSTLRKPLQQGNSTSNARVLNLISRSSGRRAQPSAAERYQNTVQELKNHKLASDLTKQISRRWKAGDVYAPHDLSPVEMQKWRQRRKPERDVVDVLKLDVLGEYKNFSVMSEYMTPMGRIKPATETGLRKVNQRKMAKAIRRSIGLGLMPSVHRHPEILYKESARARETLGRWSGSSVTTLSPGV